MSTGLTQKNFKLREEDLKAISAIERRLGTTQTGAVRLALDNFAKHLGIDQTEESIESDHRP